MEQLIPIPVGSGAAGLPVSSLLFAIVCKLFSVRTNQG